MVSCYAIKSIDNKIMDLIVYTWEECSKLVTGHRAVFKSFGTEDEAKEFLCTAPATVQAVCKTVPSEQIAKKYPNQIKVSFSFPVFSTADNSYCAYQYIVEEDDMEVAHKKIVCVGAYLPIYKDVCYEFNGEWKNGKRGYQFHVSTYEEITETKEQIVKYLACGIYKGISLKTATKIYERFGEYTFDYIENAPMELTKIPRITERKALLIHETYKTQRQSKDIIQYLQPFGVSIKKANAVFNKFGVESMEIIKEKPYRLCEIEGISFDVADRIAMKENLPADSEDRFDCCARHILKVAELEGHLGLDKEVFGKAMLSKLNNPLITPKKILDYTIGAIQDKRLIYEVARRYGKPVYLITTPYYSNMERNIANHLHRIHKQNMKENAEVTEERIHEIAKSIGINLDENQLKAVLLTLTSNVSVITGGAGTGKTTIIKVIAEYIKKYSKLNAVFLAPTGRASRRIKESTGYDASTIHSYLKIYDKNSVTVDDMELHDDTFFIIDECSMTDVFVMAYLMEAIGSCCKVVFVGDKNQLPSVGAGTILKDIIESGMIPVSSLEKIYRQDSGSKICTNAEKIKNGDINLEYDDCTFKRIETKGLDSIQAVMIEEVMQKIDKFGIDNVTCLSPYKEYDAGVKNMNALLQARINPPAPNKAEWKVGNVIFRENDRVMNLKNDSEYMISNGDIGTIISIQKTEDDEYNITVDFYGEEVIYNSDNIESLQHAYCSTYHKAQGSEYDAVVLCLSTFHRNMLKRNLFYTGVTRSKREITIVGEETAFNSAILNEDIYTRNTFLWYHILREFGGFLPLP